MIAEKQNWTCTGSECQGVVPLSSLWNLDHIVPLFKGGTNLPENLQVLCSTCHNIKTQRERVDFFFEKRLQALNFTSPCQLVTTEDACSIRVLRDKIRELEAKLECSSPLEHRASATCAVYLNKDAHQQRWRLMLPRSRPGCKSKYFSDLRHGSVESAKQALVDWCEKNNIVPHFTN
jgi:hypothetical protein